MPRSLSSGRPRISIDIDVELRQRIRVAAARDDVTVGQYVLAALEQRLRQEADDSEASEGLTAATDPVLAQLWDNSRDAAYDKL